MVEFLSVVVEDVLQLVPLAVDDADGLVLAGQLSLQLRILLQEVIELPAGHRGGIVLLLLSLLQLVTPDLQLPEAGPVARSKRAIPAQVIGDGSIKAIELRAVTAAALLVGSATALAVGSQPIVRAIDAISGVEYALPCKVMWVYGGGAPYTMALVVDGIPTRSVFGTVTEPPIGMNLGPTERLVG